MSSDGAGDRAVGALPVVGLVLAAGGLVSYFAFFARFPWLRDTAALNLALVAAGVAAAGWGLVRALRRGGWLRVGAAGLCLAAAVACAALLGAYVLHLSRQLPSVTARTSALDRAPEFALSDSTGATVDLASFRGRRVLLVFYRGWW